MNELAQVLNTKDRKEQAARVKTLLQAAQAPVVDLIIRFDGRTGQLAIKTIGPDMPVAAVYKLLDSAREVLHNVEVNSLKEQAPKEELSTPKAE
jgi:hypothetical protein